MPRTAGILIALMLIIFPGSAEAEDHAGSVAIQAALGFSQLNDDQFDSPNTGFLLEVSIAYYVQNRISVGAQMIRTDISTYDGSPFVKIFDSWKDSRPRGLGLFARYRVPLRGMIELQTSAGVVWMEMQRDLSCAWGATDHDCIKPILKATGLKFNAGVSEQLSPPLSLNLELHFVYFPREGAEWQPAEWSHDYLLFPRKFTVDEDMTMFGVTVGLSFATRIF